MTHVIEHLCVIGVGLIGGSFARAIRTAGMVEKITGCGRDAENLRMAKELGVIDYATHNLVEAVSDADVIFIATPVGTMKTIFQALKGHLKQGAIVTDGGSTKANVLKDIKDVFGEIPDFFVPGHPIAGTENSGVKASFAELYKNHRVILTPVENTSPKALETIKACWLGAGAIVNVMDAEHHDLVLAATSHLPHLLAYTLVDTLATVDEKREIFTYAAGGFRDFTRIASSNPVMWRDICTANKSALLEHLYHFRKDLDAITEALEKDDSEFLLEVFSRAKKTRDELL